MSNANIIKTEVYEGFTINTMDDGTFIVPLMYANEEFESMEHAIDWIDDIANN